MWDLPYKEVNGRADLGCAFS